MCVCVCVCVQLKDMRERLEEAESLGVRKMKAQLSAMESRVNSLEEQLDVATRYLIIIHTCRLQILVQDCHLLA